MDWDTWQPQQPFGNAAKELHPPGDETNLMSKGLRAAPFQITYRAHPTAGCSQVLCAGHRAPCSILRCV